MLRYILEAEMAIFMRYKIDPFTLESKLSTQDFQYYIKDWTARVEQENKQKSKNSNKLMESLAAIRDILNYIMPAERSK